MHTVILYCLHIDPGHAQPTSSLLFQCQSSSNQNGLVYTPNIPDFYFNDVNAADFRTGSGANLTTSMFGTIYIFTIPPESPLRNCSGTVVSLQYCYQARDRDIGMTRDVFDFLSLVQDGMQFTVKSSVTIRTIPQNNICCDNTSLSLSDQFQLPSSSFAFSVAITKRNVRPLAFTNSTSEYCVKQYRVGQLRTNPGSKFTFFSSEQVNDGSLLFRFFIGKLSDLQFLTD